MNIIKIDYIYNYNEKFEDVDKIMKFIQGSIVRTSEDIKIKVKDNTKIGIKNYIANANELNKICYELKSKIEKKQNFNKQDIEYFKKLIIYNKTKNRQITLMGIVCLIFIIIYIIKYLIK